MPTIKRNLMRKIAILLLPSAIFAQQNTTQLPRPWGPRTGPFQLSISATQAVFDAGQSVKIEAVLRNVSTSPAPQRRVGGVLPYVIEVLIPSESWLPFRSRAPLTKEGERATAPANLSGTLIRDIEPNRQIADTVDVASLFDMSLPGEYLITFMCQQPAGPGDEVSHLVDVRSNQLKITIRRP